MHASMTVQQPFKGPNGEPFAVVGKRPSGDTITMYHVTEAAAWDCRDLCLDCGWTNVRVLGAPCRMSAVTDDSNVNIAIVD